MYIPILFINSVVNDWVISYLGKRLPLYPANPQNFVSSPTGFHHTWQQSFCWPWLCDQYCLVNSFPTWMNPVGQKLACSSFSFPRINASICFIFSVNFCTLKWVFLTVFPNMIQRNHRTLCAIRARSTFVVRDLDGQYIKSESLWRSIRNHYHESWEDTPVWMLQRCQFEGACGCSWWGDISTRKFLC